MHVIEGLARILSFIVWLTLTSVVSGQPVHEETWFGTLDVKVARLRLEFKLTRNAQGEWSGKMISLDQGNSEILAASTERSDRQLIMTFPAISAEFSGALNETGDVAKGTFTQFGRKHDLELRRVDRVPQSRHVESWQGTLRAAGREFEFQLRFFQDDDRKRSAVLDSFSELIEGLPLELTETDQSLEFVVSASNARFVGKRSEDGNRLIGHWEQSGGKFPLEFSRITLEQTRSLSYRRPQTPQPPFPYASIELKVPIAEGKYELSGTLTHPETGGPFPVAILISGSGPQDRDETIFGHKPFLVIADHLTRLGVAVFRYDERGVGKSTGVFAEATTRDLANDVADICKFLSSHSLIDSKRMVLVGHSEGAMIGPLVASEDPRIAGVVMLAGPGVPGRQIILNQTRLIGKAAGMSDAALEAQHQMLLKLLAPDVRGEDGLKQAFSQALKMLQQTLPDELKGQMESLDAEWAQSMPIMVQQFESPWFQFFLDYDPAPALAKLKMPILVMIGDKDLQVDPDLNLPVIEAQLKKAGNQDVTIKRLDNLNHLFQTSTTGDPREYPVIDETFAPSALEILGDWFTKRFIASR